MIKVRIEFLVCTGCLWTTISCKVPACKVNFVVFHATSLVTSTRLVSPIRLRLQQLVNQQRNGTRELRGLFCAFEPRIPVIAPRRNSFCGLINRLTKYVVLNESQRFIRVSGRCICNADVVRTQITVSAGVSASIEQDSLNWEDLGTPIDGSGFPFPCS